MKYAGIPAARYAAHNWHPVRVARRIQSGLWAYNFRVLNGMRVPDSAVILQFPERPKEPEDLIT